MSRVELCQSCSAMFTGEFPCSRCGWTPGDPLPLFATEHRRLHVLSQTYPGYRITRVDSGWWFAYRLRAITEADRAMGVLPAIGRPDGMALGLVLAQQTEILMSRGQV